MLTSDPFTCSGARKHPIRGGRREPEGSGDQSEIYPCVPSEVHNLQQQQSPAQLGWSPDSASVRRQTRPRQLPVHRPHSLRGGLAGLCAPLQGLSEDLCSGQSCTADTLRTACWLKNSSVARLSNRGMGELKAGADSGLFGKRLNCGDGGWTTKPPADGDHPKRLRREMGFFPISVQYVVTCSVMVKTRGQG